MTNKISFYQLVSIGLFIFLFTILFIFNSEAYNFLSKEDHLIEYLSSISLAITGLFFIRAFVYSRKAMPGKSTKWNIVLFMFLAIVFLSPSIYPSDSTTNIFYLNPLYSY